MILWIAGGVLVVLVAFFLTALPGERSISHQLRHLYSVEDEQFERTMGNLLGPPLVDGNEVSELLNGDQIFPAMLEAIRSARKTVCFETYIYWSGDIGRAFARALAERAKAGVRVHVIIDWLGGLKIDDTFLELMKETGVELVRYRPLRFFQFYKVNFRTHRKLLIVDGRVGFTGGVGIADVWTGDAQDPDHWRDSHFRLEGPAVAQMQSAFMDNWMQERAEVLHGPDYFPQLPTAGEKKAQLFVSSARQGNESVRLMFLLSIACARHSIRLANSYFVPDELAIRTLVQARERGVDVEIVVPGKRIDSAVSRFASRASWGDLLRSGVKIYEYQPTMYHCKVMIVDDRWASVGSTNFDNRSFRLNDEANLNVLDRGLARRLAKTFEEDRQRSRQVTLAAWSHRPWQQKLFDYCASLLRLQL